MDRRGWQVEESEFRLDVNYHYLWPLKQVEEKKMELADIYKHAPLKARLCLKRIPYPVTPLEKADADLYRLALELEEALHQRAELVQKSTERKSDGELTTPSCKRFLTF